MKELWKELEDYPGYEVSNTGKVISYKRNVKGTILNGSYDRDGYIRLRMIDKNNKSRYPRIHRLVAKAFLPNPNNLPQVNHKDENKENNCVNNLEWCTIEYNNNYGTRNERISNTQLNSERNYDIFKGSGNPRAKKVYCNELNKSWDCIKDASIELGLKSLGQTLKAHIEGKRKTCGVYNGIKLTWKYID